MSSFNLFVNSVPANAWTAEGGTALEAVGKTSVEPEAPAETPLLKSSTIKQVFSVKFAIPEALRTALEAGGKVVAATIHVNAKAAVAGSKIIKLACTAGVTNSELEWSTTTEPQWRSANVATPGLLTVSGLEAIAVEVEHLKANAVRMFEVYLSVEVEEASGKSQTFQATLSFAGGLPRNVLANLAGALSFAGALGRVITRALGAALSFAGLLRRTVTRALGAALTFAGAARRNASHQLTAALSFAASVAASAAGQFVKHLTASLSFAGALARTVARQHQAGLTFAAGVSRTTSRALTAALGFQGGLRRTVTKPVTAALSFAGGLQRSILARLKATLGFGGHLGTGQSQEEQVGNVQLADAPASTTELGDAAAATATLADSALSMVALSDAPLDPDSRGMGYVVGQRVRLTGTFRANGALADPTTVTVKVQDAAGIETDYADAIRDSEGVWHKDITITAPGGGTWYYRFEGTGAVLAAGETSFGVEQTQF